MYFTTVFFKRLKKEKKVNRSRFDLWAIVCLTPSVRGRGLLQFRFHSPAI